MAWLYFRNRMNYHKSKFFARIIWWVTKKVLLLHPILMCMSRKQVEIVLAQGGNRACLYSFRFEGERLSEFEKFLMKYKEIDEFKLDFAVLLKRLLYFLENGADDRYFRPEGKFADRVLGLPAQYLDSSRLRLYCVKMSDSVLLLGNGGDKHTETYQEDADLNRAVETLQKIDFVIRGKEKKKEIVISGTKWLGDVIFEIED